MNEYDAVFSTVKFYQGAAASPCHKAIALTTAKFDRHFPGWPLYRRLVIGDDLLDRQIKAFFLGAARKLSRARTRTGREYIGMNTRGPWIRQAGLDAMDYVLFGKYAEGLHERANRLGVAHKTYQKIRDPIALGIRFGLDQWIGECHANFSMLLDKMKLGIFDSV